MLLESFDGNDEDMSMMKRKMALQPRKPGKKISVSKGTRVPKVVEKIKSPSDTTIYAPALQRHNDAGLNHQALVNKSPQGSPQFVQPETLLVGRQPSSQPELLDEVDLQQVAGVNVQEEEAAKQDAACTAAEQLVVDAKKYRANIEQPKGIVNTVGRFDLAEFKHFLTKYEDDKFFHLTCHINVNMRQKIEHGEYVDLECLLPKTRFQTLSEEQHMQFINKDGASYLEPADRDLKITGIRHWEQTFRIYAAIYSKANPHRSSEIWQYIYIINTAASSYVWENVAYYDFTFRQLMSERPEQS